MAKHAVIIRMILIGLVVVATIAAIWFYVSNYLIGSRAGFWAANLLQNADFSSCSNTGWTLNSGGSPSVSTRSDQSSDGNCYMEIPSGGGVYQDVPVTSAQHILRFGGKFASGFASSSSMQHIKVSIIIFTSSGANSPIASIEKDVAGPYEELDSEKMLTDAVTIYPDVVRIRYQIYTGSGGNFRADQLYMNFHEAPPTEAPPTATPVPSATPIPTATPIPAPAGFSGNQLINGDMSLCDGRGWASSAGNFAVDRLTTQSSDGNCYMIIEPNAGIYQDVTVNPMQRDVQIGGKFATRGSSTGHVKIVIIAFTATGNSPVAQVETDVNGMYKEIQTSTTLYPDITKIRYQIYTGANVQYRADEMYMRFKDYPPTSTPVPPTSTPVPPTPTRAVIVATSTPAPVISEVTCGYDAVRNRTFVILGGSNFGAEHTSNPLVSSGRAVTIGPITMGSKSCAGWTATCVSGSISPPLAAGTALFTFKDVAGRDARGICSNTGTPGGTISPAVTTTSCLKSQGDADCNGRITLRDFEVWSEIYLGLLASGGEVVRDTPQAAADFNEDNKVNLTDFQIWSEHLPR